MGSTESEYKGLFASRLRCDIVPESGFDLLNGYDVILREGGVTVAKPPILIPSKV